MLTVTATNLPRLLTCNGSRLVGGLTPPTIAGDDTVKKEGDAADWIVQQVYSGQITAEELIDRKAPNGVHITAEMIEHLDEYLKATIGGLLEYSNSYIVGPVQINGRADLVKYDPTRQHLDIGDLKYGWGIIEPEMNWTLLSHVFGFMAQNPDKIIHSATLTIYQPRPRHYFGPVRSWSLNASEIIQYFNIMGDILRNLSDSLITSQNCYKCPVLATCPAARKAQLNAIEASEMAYNETVDNETLSFFLDHFDRAVDILTQSKKAYEEMALHRIKEGQIIKNYSLETGLSNRDWVEHATPEVLQMLTGKDLTKKKLVTPAQAEKAGVNKDIVASLTERHNTSVKLVRIDANKKAEKHLKQKGN